jgi:hypothetical protein
MKIDKWELIGYIFAVTNPIIPGILTGIMLYTERKHKTAGRNVIILSILMTILYLTLIAVSIPRIP